MDSEELFDATLLEQTVVSLIEKGRRNLAIDLSRIEYVYSDTINKIINLNHRMLNVYGRLAILMPSKQVSQILHRAGIQNFIKIYINEEEMKKASDEMIQQTTAISLKDIEAMQRSAQQPQRPVSEFEELRSEIGRAIDKGSAEPAYQPEPLYQAPKQDYTAQPPKKEQQPSYFEPSYTPSFSPAPSQQYDFSYQPPPSQPSFEPPAMPRMQSFETQMPVFSQPAMPEFQKTAVPPRQEVRKSPAFAQAQEKFPGIPDRKFDRMRERIDDDFGEKKKKFPVLLVLILLVLCAILGGGIYYFLTQQLTKQTTLVQRPAPIQTQQTVPPPQPQEPVTQPTTVATEEPATSPVPPKPTPVEEELTKPVERQTPAAARIREPAAEKPKPQRREERVARAAPVREQAPKKQAAAANKISINSTPSGATVTANGKVIGTTPYTWENPDLYGMISLTIEKEGYSAKNATIEYTGGTVKKTFNLGQEVARAEPQKPVPQRQPESEVTRPVSTPSYPEEEVPERTVPQSRPATPPVSSPATTSPPQEATADEGEGATIFISSLPPMAEVFLDGKKIGTTNIAELKVSIGSHTMRFVKGDKEDTRQMTFTAGKNPSQLIRLK